MSKRKLTKLFEKELRRNAHPGTSVYKDTLHNIAANLNVGVGEFNELVDNLRTADVLQYKGNGEYVLQP